MIWQTDGATQIAAQKFPIPIHSGTPLPQEPGISFYPSTWRQHLRANDSFLPPLHSCNPSEIIAEFAAGHYLQGLARTISWGTMTRTKGRYIYRQHQLQHIHNVVDQCAHSIQQTQSIQRSWSLLTDVTQGLNWSNVMASKTLHFLCRALGFHQDPPVPIDEAVILNYVWPGFRIGIPPGQRPAGWSGNNFTAYCRYVTAILEWARMRNWTTTEVETTIYAENY
jgi:hypothetical protein